MRRYRERPSMAHVITTCIALFYILPVVTCSFFAVRSSEGHGPKSDDSTYSWLIGLTFNLILAWIIFFLTRELFRQYRLYRQFKKT